MGKSLTLFVSLWIFLLGCKGEEMPSPELEPPQDLAELDLDSAEHDTSEELDAPIDAELDEWAEADSEQDADEEQPPALDWLLSIESAAGVALPPALLGHYDLSGALYRFDEQPGLIDKMRAVGLSDWRMSVGRWEAYTLILPSLTDGSPCSFPIAEAFAPEGTTELDLIQGRDWFIDDGGPVSLAQTADDARYSLGYVRALIARAEAFGAQPFMCLDHMPRALAVNRQPERRDCAWTAMNKVSNVRPADPSVYAAAVVGLVQRVVEGSDGEAGRAVQYWEIGNEPELPQFWDPSYENGLDRYFEMTGNCLVQLAQYRDGSALSEVRALRFGFGSFANSETALAALSAFDLNPLPNGEHLPFDFLSFHVYDDDPLAVAARIDALAEARAKSAHYQGIELVLAEWGPELDSSAGDPVYNASMEAALHPATVLVLAAHAGLNRAHRSIFWAYLPGMGFGLVDHEGALRPAYHAYVLLHTVFSEGAQRLVPRAPADARFDNGQGVVLASRDAAGRYRALFVNRSEQSRRVGVELDGQLQALEHRQMYSGGSEIVSETLNGALSVELPARSLTVLEW